MAKVKLKQQTTGEIKEVPIGFSWTMFFFGPFVPLFRGDFKWFFLIIFTLGIASLFGIFIYNKKYIKNLIEQKGFQPADEVSRQLLINKGIIMPGAHNPTPEKTTKKSALVTPSKE